jgi:hypothetical protein
MEEAVDLSDLPESTRETPVTAAEDEPAAAEEDDVASAEGGA